MTTTIQVRIDSTTKTNVEAILSNLGLDMTTAIRIYLKKNTTYKVDTLSSFTRSI